MIVIVIVFGVSGAGKTTIGKLLSEELGWRFYEGDDFHPAANIEKMRHEIPLNDDDRWPWLEKLRELIERLLAEKEDAVLACSALKEKYRRHLKVDARVKFVYLRGDFALIADRLRHCKGHFMKPALLQSQFADLEEPQPAEDAVVIDLNGTPRELAQQIKSKFGLTHTD